MGAGDLQLEAVCRRVVVHGCECDCDDCDVMATKHDDDWDLPELTDQMLTEFRVIEPVAPVIVPVTVVTHTHRPTVVIVSPQPVKGHMWNWASVSIGVVGICAVGLLVQVWTWLLTS